MKASYKENIPISMNLPFILLFCIIEIILLSPRTMFYIVIDLFPYRLFDIPVITLTCLITFAGFVVAELTTERDHLQDLKIFRVAVYVWCMVVALSAIFNPLRDVIFESQGSLIFMSNVVLFAVAGAQLGERRRWLLWGIFLSVSVTLFILNYILLTNPNLLPPGYSLMALRYEGLYTSTPIVGLVAISAAFVFLSKSKIEIGAGIAGFVISFVGLVMTASKGTLLGCIVALLFVLSNAMSRSKVFLSLPLISIVIISIYYLLPSMSEHLRYLGDRLFLLRADPVDLSRVDEWKKDFSLFFESPIFGHGYGLVNKYILEKWGMPLYSHNILMSLLSRTGLLGVGFIIWYGWNLVNRVRKCKDPNAIIERSVALGTLLGVLVLLMVSNFAGLQIMGFYGALAGLAVNASPQFNIVSLNNI